MTPDIVYDQMLGMGCADKLMFSWGGNPGVGSLHRLRDAIENNYPHHIEIKEHAHAAMANAYVAGASDMPCAIFKGYRGTDYPGVNSDIRFISCPYTGETLTVVPAIKPDLAIIHAQRADKQGNIWLKGIVGIIVDQVDEKQGGIVIPRWVVNAVCCVPKGAFPSYTEGYYNRSNDFYIRWDEISRDRQRFLDWMDTFVLSTTDFSEFMLKLEKQGYV